MLKLGYKASAEQFAPARAAGVRRAGRGAGLRHGRRRPTTSSRGATTAGTRPSAFAWLGALARPHRRGSCSARAWSTPTLPLPPGASSRRRWPRSAASTPGRVILGVGTGESMNEVAARHRLAGQQGALRPAQGGGQADPAAVDRGARDASRASTTAPSNATDLRPPGAAACRSTSRASGPAAARLAGRVGRRLHHHQRQGPELYTDTLLPGRARGRREGRPHARRRSS